MDIHKSLQTTLEIYIIKLCHSNPLQKVMYVSNENGEKTIYSANEETREAAPSSQKICIAEH